MNKLRLLFLVVILSTVIVFGFACTRPISTPPTVVINAPIIAPSNTPVVQITMHPDKPGITIPPDFLGISFDAATLANDDNYFDVKNIQFTNLLHNLGNGVLSFGATGLDHTYWSGTKGVSFKDADAVISPSDVDRLFDFVQETGWRVIFGLNLGANNPKMAADEASYVANIAGGSLIAFQIGNEPDLYYRNGLRKADYTYADYQQEFNAYLSAMRGVLPNIPIAGPATASNFTWFSNFLSDETKNLIMATTHHYPLNAYPNVAKSDPKYASIQNLLSTVTTNGTANLIKKFEKAAQTNNVPLRFDETNSSYPAKGGLGDTFAASLWGADYLFNLAENGVVGANFFGTFLCNSYSPICLNNGFLGFFRQYQAQPLYFAMLLFHSAAQGRIVPVDITTASNVTVHAALGDDGKLHLTIINKDPMIGINAQIATGSSYAQATAVRLTAKSLSSQGGVTFAGSSVNSDGTWFPSVEEQVNQNSTGYTIFVPAASAVVVTFGN